MDSTLDPSVKTAAIWMSVASLVGFVTAGVLVYKPVRRSVGKCPGKQG